MCVCRLYLTFCDFMGYSPPGISVHGTFQQEYWSSLPFLPPEDLPDPGIAPKSPVSPTLAGGFFNAEPPGKPPPSTWMGVFVPSDRALLKLRFLMSHCRRNSGRDKVVGKK